MLPIIWMLLTHKNLRKNEREMKILLFRTDPSIMNIKSYNSQEIGMAKSYIKLGHQCDIVYYAGNQPSREEIISVNDKASITIYWRKGFSIFNNGIFPGINKIIEKYDVIQVSEYYFFSSWYVCEKYRKEKIIYIYQGVYDSDNSIRYKIRCKIMDPLLLNKDILTSISVFTKSKMAYDSMARRGFRKIETVGVGLDIERLHLQCDLPKWAKDLQSSKGKSKYLLYVGVIEDRRNILFLLNVVRTLANKYSESYFKLIIVGKGEKKYIEECRKYIEDNNIQNYIIYFESISQSEISNIYKISDLFVFPSKYEIFGMVLMEAMNFGLPVISSYNGGASTVITNGSNGIIIDNFNVDEWASKISEMLESNLLQKTIGRNAKQTALLDFGWENITRRILDTLDIK